MSQRDKEIEKEKSRSLAPLGMTPRANEAILEEILAAPPIPL